MNDFKSLAAGVLSIGLLLSACSEKQGERDYGPAVRMHMTDSLRLSDYFTEIRYLHFDDNPEAVFGEVNKLMLVKDRIFILDGILKSVICFDTTGRFLYRIQRVGKGPGEYAGLNAMWVDENTRQLWVHCRIPDKTILFSWNGDYIREIPGDRGAEDRLSLDDGSFFSYAIYKHGFGRDTVAAGIYQSDPSGRFRRNLVNLGMASAYWTVFYKTRFAETRDSIYLLSQSDSILRFDRQGRHQVDVRIDWGEYRMPDDLRTIGINSPKIRELENHDAIFWKDRLLVTGPLRWFVCGKRNQFYFGLIDKRSMTGMFTQQIYNELGSLPVTFPEGQGDNGELLGLLQMDMIWVMAESLEAGGIPAGREQEYHAFKAFLQRSIEADRPVLIRMRLKREFVNPN